MPNIEIPMSLLTLILVILISGFIGFVLRGGQLKKKQLKISELRREMVSNHAQILEMEKEFVALESRLRDAKTPILPFKVNAEQHNTQAANG